MLLGFVGVEVVVDAGGDVFGVEDELLVVDAEEDVPGAEDELLIVDVVVDIGADVPDVEKDVTEVVDDIEEDVPDVEECAVVAVLVEALLLVTVAQALGNGLVGK